MLAAVVALAEPAVADDALGLFFAFFECAAELLWWHVDVGYRNLCGSGGSELCGGCAAGGVAACVGVGGEWRCVVRCVE